MVLFLLFNGIPQKTVAAITNYTEQQVNMSIPIAIFRGKERRGGERRR